VYGVWLWKNIMRDWGKFSSHTRFEVGVNSLREGCLCSSSPGAFWWLQSVER
jgi:hypothetical protein